ALAAKGKEEWNKWRHANKDARVTFEGVDFSEAPKDRIDFSGFGFGHHANFSKCKWRGAEWRESEDNCETFAPGRACFIGASFGNEADFSCATFGDFAIFEGAAFGVSASFSCTTFGNGTFFDAAAFGARATFRGAAFGLVAFRAAVFHGSLHFTGYSIEK